MGIVEAFLILVGVTLIICSFFITEKLSPKDLKKISELSEREISVIMEKRLIEAESKIDDMVDKSVDLSLNKINRELNQETDDKIMAIGEYSDNVMESLTKTHNEVTFLYSMLSDKHDELTRSANDATEIITELKDLRSDKEEIYRMIDDRIKDTLTHPDSNVKGQEEVEVLTKELSKVLKNDEDDGNAKSVSVSNHNDEIIKLYQEGMEPVEIAKELKIGYGEVLLVIDLYK